MTKGPVLILGATSDIGQATAHAFANKGHPIQLAARNSARLAAHQTDLQVRYIVPVSLHECDALATETHAAFIDGLSELPDIAVSAVGVLGNQAASETDFAAAIVVIRSNFEGPASLLSELAKRFETRGSGTLVGISSVAGIRGRASNFIYGSGKAGFSAFLSGLRNRLANKGVHVVTVLPGFVNTQMTANLNLSTKLTAEPKEVADAIVNAVDKRKNVIYIRPIWRIIMLIIGFIPEPIFKRLNI